jgi:rRNA biogenesis protein RRP5
MAPVEKKRKGGPTNESFARSKKTDGENRPSKRIRSEHDGDDTKTSKIPAVPKISRIREEEVAFPRGGASILTPLEHKQIQIEATRDVLFEQGAKSSKGNEEVGDIDNSERKKNRSKSKNKVKKGDAPGEPEEPTVKIEGLSYKVGLRYSWYCY